MVDFLFALVELFRYYLSGAMRRNVYSSAVFAEGRPLALKFCLDRIISTNHSWYQKTRDTWLPDGEDRILLHSLVLTQYRSVTDVRTDGQTDRRPNGFAVAYTALEKLALRRAVKLA